MNSRRIISLLMAVLLILSTLSIVASAEETDLAQTGYYNQNYLENYATKAESTTDLGATYTKNATTFKVWAPEATSVSVKRYTTGTDAESGAAVIGENVMTYNSTTGIWSLTISGDLKNQYYTYIVARNGASNETQDPYAKAVGANGDRAMVCDLDSTDPAGWDQDQHVLFDNPGEAVVWEIHVRDFSIDVSSGVSEANRGKYLAFTEGNTTVNSAGKVASCVDYLVEHNVNCVQLMPIEDFASIDETDDAIKRNWGYDPKNYNVPEGSYSSDPYDGNTRIKEFKMLVQALHDRGISVVMDVVYNHTFVREGSSLNITTPNYYYRMSSATEFHNGSGLGSVLSSEKKMTSKFISDSLCYWVNEYHIDGFRFDLMGCHDITNLNIWRQKLDSIDPRILMYGEPWTGGSDNGISNGVTKSTLKQLTRIGAFNETYSDSLKGSHDEANQAGFLNGQSDSEMRKAGAGQATDFSGAKVNQFVNYADNHDNWTLFDKLLATNGTSGYVTGSDGQTTGGADLYTKNKNVVDNPSANVINQMKLALTSTLTSQGIPFTVAGTEFCRTKYGDRNSYRTPDKVNAINWNRAATYADVANYYAGLIAIRNAVSAFSDSKADSTTNVNGCTAWQITNNKSGQWNKVIVALNNSGSAKSISLSGSWVVVANGTKAGTVSLGNASGSYSVPAYSGVILVDAASFSNYTQPNPGVSTVITEHYTRDAETGTYTKTMTETAKYKEGQTWRASQSLAILFDHNLDKIESTAAGNATYGSVIAGTTITVKYYYTRYIASGYLTIKYLSTTDGARVKAPIKYRLRDGDSYSIPANSVMGYELDTSRYPAKTRGTFDASKPATFNFYYKKLPNDKTIVHFYYANTIFKSSASTILCYAYDDDGNEPLRAWALQKKGEAGLKADTSMGTGWGVVTVPATSCYVMFHILGNDGAGQIPSQGEKGFVVSGEAWIKDNVVSFNNTIVTSHIDLETGAQLSNDVRKDYTNVKSNATYSTLPNTALNRKYIVPANSTGYYEAGVTNVVYLYTEQTGPTPTQPTEDQPTQPQPGGKVLMGDADGDGEVTILDATFIQRVLVNLQQPGADYSIAADVDGDHEVTIVDATFIQRALAGLKDDNVTVNQWVGGGSDPTTEPEPSQPAEPTSDPGIRTIYFTNNKHWENVYAYIWEEGVTTGVWPGEPILPVDYNQWDEGIYAVTLSINDSVIFNDGESQQTTDIPVGFLLSNAIYCEDQTDDEGHYLYGEWNYDPDAVDPGPGPGPGPSTGGRVYMAPSTEWKRDGARFAAYFFEDKNTFTWVNMQYAGPDLYYADIPSGYSWVVFARMNGATTENNWNNKWNQTEDIPIEAGSTYTVVGWGKTD